MQTPQSKLSGSGSFRKCLQPQEQSGPVRTRFAVGLKVGGEVTANASQTTFGVEPLVQRIAKILEDKLVEIRLVWHFVPPFKGMPSVQQSG